MIHSHLVMFYAYIIKWGSVAGCLNYQRKNDCDFQLRGKLFRRQLSPMFNLRGISICLNRMWGENITFSIFSLVYISVLSVSGHFFQKKKIADFGPPKKGSKYDQNENE